MIAIDRAAAVEQVTTRCATDDFPALTGPEVEDIVDQAARPDAEGHTPYADDWLPTFDLNAACAQAWELKAVRTATKFDANIDGQQLDRSQIHDQCIKMARFWRGKVAGVGPRA